MKDKEIKIILEFGNYTLITYEKAGRQEWNCAYKYEAESKSWAEGNYAYSLEGALIQCLKCMKSNALKNKYQTDIEERNPDLTYSRITELATLFKDGLIEDDKEQALIYFSEICEMSNEEKEFFGIEDNEDEDDE